MNAKHQKDLSELGERLIITQDALNSSDSNAGRFIADLQGQMKTVKADRTAILNNLDKAKQENEMLKANNDHLLSANGTLQSNVQKIELNIVSLKAELTCANNKMEVMIGESN
jgi:chromosome segregation ATPase